MIGKSAAEAVGRNPGAATKILVQSILSTAFAEGIVFFALFLWNGKYSLGRGTRWFRASLFEKLRPHRSHRDESAPISCGSRCRSRW
jgi:hypothetical protein